MGSNKERHSGLSFQALSLVHVLSGLFIFWRCLSVELLWLWPRQPVSFIVLVLPPRIVTAKLPLYFYQSIGILFDGDATPLLLVTAWVSLFLVGGLDLDFLWKKAGRVRKLCTISIFFLGPVTWALRIYLEELEHQTVVAQTFTGLLKHENENERLYNYIDHLTNAHGGKNLLKPDMTFTFKEVDLNTLAICDNAVIPAPFAPEYTVDNGHKLHDEGLLELDIYKPIRVRSDGKKPGIVLHIHGGGWEKGHRRFLAVNYHGGVPHAILEENMIVSISYRLSCNAVHGDQMLEDLYDATKYIISHADEWGADGSKIIPWGTSAGGNLALLLAYRFREDLNIKGVINFYGVTELREKNLLSMAESWYEEQFHRFFIKATRHVCATSKDKNKCFENMSPLAHVDKMSPPTVTVHGRSDGLVLNSHAFYLSEALQRANVTHANLVVPGQHDCDVHVSSPCSQAAIHAIRKLIALVF